MNESNKTIKRPNDGLLIREASLSDTSDITRLTRELGYPVEPFETESRLEEILAFDHQRVFLAELEEKVVGWAHVFLCPLLICPKQAQIGGLVVKDGLRNHGIGNELMKFAENWARDKGCIQITVFTNIIRTDAHRFYAQHGYTTEKTEYVMHKLL